MSEPTESTDQASDICDNPACQRELADYKKKFYEEPNYEKLIYGFSKMEDIISYITRLQERNKEIQEKTELFKSMADDRIADLKEMLSEAEEERAAKKRQYKKRIEGLELMLQGKVGEARKIRNSLDKEKKEKQEAKKVPKKAERVSSRINKNQTA